MNITLEQLKNALQSVKHILSRKAEAPDWQDNDPTSLSYIKGRKGGYDVIEEECAVLFDGLVGKAADGEFTFALSTAPTAGKEYKVNVEEYEYITTAIMQTVDGDVYLVFADNPETIANSNLCMVGNLDGIDLSIFKDPSTGQSVWGQYSEVNIKISETVATPTKKCVQFPVEYIPIPSITEADNGKVLGVVDGRLAWVDK